MKIYAARCAAIVAVLLVQPGISSAQTADEMYASMCRTAEQRGSEACGILLDAKERQANPAAAANATTPTTRKEDWGPLLNAIEGTWKSDNPPFSAVHKFAWVVPGEVMREDIADFEKDALFARITAWFRYNRDDGRIYYEVEGQPRVFNGRVAADGSLVLDSLGNKKATYFSTISSSGPRNLIWSGYKRKGDKVVQSGKPRQFRALPASDLDGAIALYRDERAGRRSAGGGFMAAMTGAIMGAATGYAQSGGSSVGAVAGAMGGAVVGKAGGNDALYQQMQTANAQATADAEASQRQLQRTVAQARRGGSTAPSLSPAVSSTPTSRAAPATSAASDAGAARSGAAPMTRYAYLYANMPLRDLAGANAKCVSNVFQLRFSADTKEWGDVDAKARAAAATQFPAFIAKCNSGGKGTVQGEPSWVIADGPGGEPIRTPHVNPVDTVVRMP